MSSARKLWLYVVNCVHDDVAIAYAYDTTTASIVHNTNVSRVRVYLDANLVADD
jgi:hypothetical protein